MPGLLSAPQTIEVRKDSATKVSIPLQFPPGLQPGTSPATLVFSFGSPDRFAPSEFPITLHVMGWVQSNAVVLGGGLVLLLLVAAFIVLLVWRSTRGKPVHFEVLVDDEPVHAAPVSLRAGRELFLNDTGSAFALVPQRNARSVAKLTVTEGRVPLVILKRDRFPKLTESLPDSMGQTIVIRTESGKNLSLKVRPEGQSPSGQKSQPPETTQASTKVQPRRRVLPKSKAAGGKAQSKERKK